MFLILRMRKWTPLGIAVFIAGCTAANITTPGGNVSIRTLGGSFTARSADGSVFSTSAVNTPTGNGVFSAPPGTVSSPPPPAMLAPSTSLEVREQTVIPKLQQVIPPRTPPEFIYRNVLVGLPAGVIMPNYQATLTAVREWYEKPGNKPAFEQWVFLRQSEFNTLPRDSREILQRAALLEKASQELSIPIATNTN